MTARASFSLELGIFTDSCMATLALRTLVSMSAMGSVMVIEGSSPAGLGDAGHLARMDHVAQADPAQAELAEHGTRAPATTAPGVTPHLELGLVLLLLSERFLGHNVLIAPHVGTGSRRQRAAPEPRNRYERW